MLNVLYLLNHAGKAGTERYVQTLIERLHGVKVNAFFAYNEDGLLVSRLRERGIPCYRLPMKNRFDFKAARKLLRLCEEFRIDIIHTQFLREDYIAMQARFLGCRAKVVYTNHFILANNFHTRITNRLLSPFNAKIIAVCNNGREQLIKNGNDERKISVIFNAVDADFWSEPLASTLRSEFNITNDCFVFLCASRFAYDKGHKFLIKSAARLKELTKHKFTLVLAGDGELLPEMKELSQSLNLSEEVIFLGFREDIKNLYYGSDVYINSSSHEALSFLIIEALASGLPVIASDMGGNPDIIDKTSDCGIQVKYDDCEDLAGAMLKLMENPGLLSEYKKGAYRIAREKFDTDIWAQKTMEVYESAL